ncbi:MAG: glycosyltransferase family 2 protein [Chitinophagales bacterium]|jgi:glycosyltransferase involved in cell wall biosynthesis|nr:glycosyltransferase family 2 protein [Chitinophagales bacterium]HNI45078.1 glycosyltransferase family 2 protein [Chitinophagales bacterium]
MKNIQLSVVIITYNEASNIANCLNSVLSIADDIVVVDSFSTDGTSTICQQYPQVRFIQHPFAGHIEQKNYAITQARFQHILSLDADEVLSPDLQQSIAVVKKKWTVDAYWLNRLNNFCGKWIRHGDWYPDRKLRLWDSSKGQWGGKNPHDRFVLQQGCTTAHLKGDLLHYSFHSLEQHIEQINKFSTIAAKGLFEAGKKATYFHLLFKPFWKFLNAYFLRLGFLDGYYGYVVCRNSAFSMYLRYVKLREMWRKTAR